MSMSLPLALGTATEGPKSHCKAPVRQCRVGTTSSPVLSYRGSGGGHGARHSKAGVCRGCSAWSPFPLTSVPALHLPAAQRYSAAWPGSESQRDGQEIVKQVACNGP